MQLAGGYVARPLQASDADEMQRLVEAYSIRLIGRLGRPSAGIAHQLSEPGFVPAEDGWAVRDGADGLAGYVMVARRGDGDRFELDLVADQPEIVRWLLVRAFERARQAGRMIGHERITVGLGMLREDQPLREAAVQHGLTPATTFQRLRIDHQPPVERPELPAGFAQHSGREVARDAYDVLRAAFADQPGASMRPYDDWVALHERRSTFDWSLLTVLEAAGTAVAVRDCTNDFVSIDNCGYVARIGVLPEARGRGLAKFLLEDTFAVDAAAGRTGTILHVDSANPTPALDLYLGVGMRPVLIIDQWRTELVTA